MCADIVGLMQFCCFLVLLATPPILHVLSGIYDFSFPVQLGIVNMLGAMSMLVALRQDSKERVLKT
jgi:hypothetical protein